MLGRKYERDTYKTLQIARTTTSRTKNEHPNEGSSL